MVLDESGSRALFIFLLGSIAGRIVIARHEIVFIIVPIRDATMTSHAVSIAMPQAAASRKPLGKPLP